MYWQQKGDYLGVKVDRYTKSKKVGDGNIKLRTKRKKLSLSVVALCVSTVNKESWIIYLWDEHLLKCSTDSVQKKWLKEIGSMWWNSSCTSSAAEIQCWELGEKEIDSYK